MKNSIQDFVENGIPELEKIRINFMKAPSLFDERAEEIKGVFLKAACQFLSELLEEGNTLLEESLKRRMSWQIKDRYTKRILTPVGTVAFTHTRFKNKETGEMTYLLDRAVGWGAHARVSDGVKAAMLEGAGGETGEKREAGYLYVEADEDHAALQFHEKKGDIKRYKGHADNGQIVKLVYVHEGYEKEAGKEGKRGKLKNVAYFGGIYEGKGNADLWEAVKGYIEREYRTEKRGKIFFQSDGGAWMKKGVEVLGAEPVLDGFHLSEYMGRMARLCGSTQEESDGMLTALRGWIEKGDRKSVEDWVEERKAGLGERGQKKLEDDWRYLKNNWEGIRRRMEGGDGMIGSSTEGHVSHVLSARMSSRPMGWSREGADCLSRLRIYWMNGGDMLELVRGGREEAAGVSEEVCLSAAELLSWERKHRRANGKYIEALRARVSQQTSVKVYFNAAIAGVC